MQEITDDASAGIRDNFEMPRVSPYCLSVKPTVGFHYNCDQLQMKPAGKVVESELKENTGPSVFMAPPVPLPIILQWGGRSGAGP